MDAFLFFSGLGLYYSMKKRSDVRSFYIRRLKRILIPYCIVAVPSYILLDVCVDKTGWGEAIKDFTFISFSVMETGFTGILDLCCYAI